MISGLSDRLNDELLHRFSGAEGEPESNFDMRVVPSISSRWNRLGIVESLNYNYSAVSQGTINNASSQHGSVEAWSAPSTTTATSGFRVRSTMRSEPPVSLNTSSDVG